jgi:hypothetical protein
MEEIKVGEEIELTAPITSPAVDSLVIVHEWGTTRVQTGANLNKWTPDSIGVHKLFFKAGTDVVSSPVFKEAYVPIINYDEFITDTPALSALSEDDFNLCEKEIRRIVQNYCGQKFGPYVGQTIEVQGDGGDSLVLPAPALALTSVQDSFGTELTHYVDISAGFNTSISTKPTYTSHWVDTKADVSFRMRDMFRETQVYVIEGDFGWEYVPSDVSAAARMLIADVFTNELTGQIQMGVVETQLGDFKLKLNADRWGSTGNGKADNMLAGYVNFGIGLV